MVIFNIGGKNMKKISSVISLSFVVLFLLVFLFPSICFSEQPGSKGWDLFGKDSGGGVYYYNKTNMTKSSDIISFKLYYIVTDDERKERIERIKKYDLKKSIEYQNYDHDISVVEVDCKNRLTKVKEFTEYDHQENVLKHNINKDSEWKSILPGSREEFYKINCVTPNKPLEKK